MNPGDPIHFLSCDWGTSSFRLRLVDRRDLAILGTVRSEEGARSLHNRLAQDGLAADPAARPAAFASVLSHAIDSLAAEQPDAVRGAPVIVSGMASSTVGWRELPYAPTPCPLDGSGLRVEEMPALSRHGSMHRVRMVSGLCTGSDMLRGEETEALGVLADPGFGRLRRRCRLVLPGTHSKHLMIRDGSIVDMRTHMTGELLELLSTRSLLAVSVEWPPAPFDAAGDGPRASAFDAGVAAAGRDGLSRSLFQVRVRSVLDRTAPADNAFFLAGVVIGAELLDLLAGDPDCPLLLAASAHFEGPYRRALVRLGASGRLDIAPPEVLARATVAAHRLVLDRSPAAGGAGNGTD